MQKLLNAKRIVIKIGSSLLVSKNGCLRYEWLQSLAKDIDRYVKNGQEVVVVSSGSVALGRKLLNHSANKLKIKKLKLEEKQACAAIGQIELAHAYSQVLQQQSITASQVLLTIDDTEQRRRYINARNTVLTLLKMGSVPIINENDTVATQEIRYGDNDRLAARVTSMISADCLVLLSDIDGLYTDNPRTNPEAQIIPQVDNITKEILQMAKGVGSSMSSGGMITKLQAAKIAMSSGSAMVISNGILDYPLSNIENGAKCTWFHSNSTPMTARQSWISGSLKTMGKVTIDNGAKKALQNGKSLLPVGITSVHGDFGKGDAISIYNTNGAEIGKGLSSYDAKDTKLIMGAVGDMIENILGYLGKSEVIHKDDIVLE